MKRFSKIFPAALGLILFNTCASSGLNRGPVDNNLPTELPKDLQERYTVRESTALQAVTPISNPSPSPTPSETATKSKKKKNVKKAETPAPAPTVAYPSRRPAVDPLWVGEKMVHEVTYFGVPAGDFESEISDYKAVDGRKVYHIRGRAQSSKVFALFYRLDDFVETFLDYEGLFSHRFHILLDETKQKRDSLEIYDSIKKQTFYWNRWDRPGRPFEETKQFEEMPAFPQDSYSALYYTRTLDMPTGKTFTFPVVSEGRNWEAVVTVVRRENISTILGGSTPAIVLKPEMKYQGILKKQGDSFMWLSDDSRKILLRLEAKVKIGTVVATLKKFEPGTPP